MIINEDELKRLIQEAMVEVIQKELSGDLITKKWMTRKEAAEYLSISTSALDKWGLLHDAPYFRFPGSTIKLYNARELDEWMIQFER